MTDTDTDTDTAASVSHTEATTAATASRIHISALQDDILISIFAHLLIPDIALCIRHTCHAWRTLSQHADTWQHASVVIADAAWFSVEEVTATAATGTDTHGSDTVTSHAVSAAQPRTGKRRVDRYAVAVVSRPYLAITCDTVYDMIRRWNR